MKRASSGTIKAITGGFLVLGFVLLFAGPMILRRPIRLDRRAYAQRAALYVGGLVISITGAGVGAFLLVRRARDEYRELALRNMQDLLEAARQDQLQKQKLKATDEERS